MVDIFEKTVLCQQVLKLVGRVVGLKHWWFSQSGSRDISYLTGNLTEDYITHYRVKIGIADFFFDSTYNLFGFMSLHFREGLKKINYGKFQIFIFDFQW